MYSPIIFAFTKYVSMEKQRQFLRKLELLLIEDDMTTFSENTHVSLQIQQQRRRVQNLQKLANKEKPPANRRRFNECPSTIDRIKTINILFKV